MRAVVVTFVSCSEDRLGKDISAGSLEVISVGIRRLAMDLYATLYRFYSRDAERYYEHDYGFHDVD